MVVGESGQDQPQAASPETLEAVPRATNHGRFVGSFWFSPPGSISQPLATVVDLGVWEAVGVSNSREAKADSLDSAGVRLGRSPTISLEGLA